MFMLYLLWFPPLLWPLARLSWESFNARLLCRLIADECNGGLLYDGAVFKLGVGLFRTKALAGSSPI